MEQLLGGLFGGQDDDDERRRGRAQDFVSRYEQGAPYDGISDEEAYHNYRQVAGRLSPQEYEASAAEAFQRLSPEERRQVAQLLQQRAGGQFGGFQGDDPRELARVTSGYRQQDPGGLASLFGGGGGGGGGMGGMLSNSLARAALGGVAAIAMKRMMGGR